MSKKKKRKPSIPWSLDRALKRAMRSGVYTGDTLRGCALQVAHDASLQQEMGRYVDRERTSLDPSWAALLDLFVIEMPEDEHRGLAVYNRLSAYPPNAVVETLMAQLSLSVWGEMLRARRHALLAVELAEHIPWPHYVLGLIHTYMGAAKRAVADFERGECRCDAAEHQLRARCLHNKAACLINARGDLSAARKVVVKALDVWPQYREAKETLATLDRIHPELRR